MASEDDERLGRETPFPQDMQGCWVEESDPTLEIVIEGAEILWGGETRDYEEKRRTEHEDGSVRITLELAGEADPEDSIEFVLLPDGSMYVFNVHFASHYVRPSPDPT